jgi:glucose/arabinose dehydrogenase
MFIPARSTLLSLTVMTCLAASAWACNKSETTATVTTSQTATASAAPKAAAAKTTEPSGKLTVSASGTKFDPPVEKSKLPAGTWICDMGSVHYARSQKGDGKCPECSMNLTQLGAHSEGQAGQAGSHAY